MNYLLEVNDDKAVATSNGERWGFSFHHSKSTQKNTYYKVTTPRYSVSQMNPTSKNTTFLAILGFTSEEMFQKEMVCLPF